MLKSYYQFVNESIKDKYLMKAIFVTGSPVSGKSFVSKILTGRATSPNIIKLYAEDIFDTYLTQFATFFDLNEAIDTEQKDELEELINYLKVNKSFEWLNTLNAITIEGEDKDLSTMIQNKTILEKLGYDVSILFINTKLDVAIARNAERVRKLPNDEMEENWRNSQLNRKSFRDEFGKDYYELTNNIEFNYNHKTHVLVKDDNYSIFEKDVRELGLQLLNKTLKNPIGVKLLSDIQKAGKKYRFDLKKSEYQNTI